MIFGWTFVFFSRSLAPRSPELVAQAAMALWPFHCQLRSYHAKSICAAVQVWLQQVLIPWVWG